MKGAHKKVFLSGGTKTAWQDVVVNACAHISGVIFFDPRKVSGGSDMRPIARAERRWLEECDCVFFYFEASNPSGLGSAFEVGFATARGKHVIFIDEKQTIHSEWVGVHCNEVHHDLKAGITSLHRFLKGGETDEPVGGE